MEVERGVGVRVERGVGGEGGGEDGGGERGGGEGGVVSCPDLLARAKRVWERD